MARHTFVTESHTFGDEKQTVDILSRAEVRSIVSDYVDGLEENIDAINEDKQKIWDILDQFKQKPPHGTKNAYERTVREFRDAALSAAKDAAAARETVEHLVETAREVFSDVIEELLAPHYRRLAALAAAAGIDVPEETTVRKEPAKKQSAIARNTPPPATVGSPLADPTKKNGKVAGRSSQKKQAELDEEIEFDTPKRRTLTAKARTKKTASTTKKTAASSRAKSKGVRLCRKK